MPAKKPTYAWWIVLCLVGLDYFSTLAYLPSIAVAADRTLAPLAGLGVVVVTLFAALPVYLYVVGRSHEGKGGIGLLERVIHGWTGKFLVLALLGFIATDFVVTRSLSVSDASTHLLANPFYANHSRWVKENQEAVRARLPGFLRGDFFAFWNEQLVLTMLLSSLAFGLYTYLVRGMTRGFLRLAVGVVVLYVLLTAIVIASGLLFLQQHQGLVDAWWERLQVQVGEDGPGGRALGWWAVVAALLAFPPMALGLSGFELSLASSPFVRGEPGEGPSKAPGRVRNTRLLILVAALAMSVFVVTSMFVVALLVPDGAIFAPKGEVRHRALAYLAHGGTLRDSPEGTTLGLLFGSWFGTLYDLSAILILCLAGASATIGLRDMVPEYLTRYGMQMRWAQNVGAILHLFNFVILLVTLAFHASVGAQQWAYATSVMALLVGAAVAAVLDLGQRWRGSWLRPLVMAPFALIAGLFVAMGVLLVFQGPSGLAIASAFVAVVMVTGMVSRYLRSKELRFEGFRFADAQSEKRWPEVCQFEFQVLVPHDPTAGSLLDKDREIRLRHRLGPDVPVLFLEATLGDPSDFSQQPEMKIEPCDGFEVIRVSHCTSIAHVLAAVALAFRVVGKPPEVHFSWSDESPMAANFRFLLFGQGNIPWMVRSLVCREEPDPAKQPRIVIG